MIDVIFVFLMTVGGLLIGLLVGLVRGHGFRWTAADMLAAGLFGYLLPVLWLGFGAMPSVRDAVRLATLRFPWVGDAMGVVLLASPIVGAFLGLWLVRLIRHRNLRPEPPWPQSQTPRWPDEGR